MRRLGPLFTLLVAACGSTSDEPEAVDADRWSGTYRYQGMTTTLRKEGRFYRFSDARFGRFRFRDVGGSYLEDDQQRPAVRVFAGGGGKAFKSEAPYPSLRLTAHDEDWILLRVE